MELNLNVEKNQGLVEKILSAVLLAMMVAALFYAYATFFSPSKSAPAAVQQSGIPVDVDFISSDDFTSLNYIPDSSIFDEVKTIDFTTGNDNPFSGL